MLLKIALKSLLNRKGSVLLTLFTLTLSILVLITVEDIRKQSKQSFNRAISGVDLIVGAPTGQLNLTLATSFGIGYLSNPVDWTSFEKIKKHPQVSWALPISLGDSHKGKRVIGTDSAYFELVKYGSKQEFVFAQGRAFVEDAYEAAEVVLGAKVASEFGYKLNDALVLSHGLGVTSFKHHDQVKFKVVGVLELTGTPTDSALFVSLSGIERMHDETGHSHEVSSDNRDELHEHHEEHAAHKDHDHEGEHEHHEEHAAHKDHYHEGEHEHHEEHAAHKDHDHEGEHEHHEEHAAHEHHDHEGEHEHHEEHAAHKGHDHEDEHEHHEEHAAHEGHDHAGHVHSTEQISAMLVGVKAKYATLMVQKYVNDFTDEPLMAVLPGVALNELWRLLGTVESLLLIISSLVLVSSLFGMCAMLLSSMRERVKEIAVFRALGAGKSFIFWLIQLEVLLLSIFASGLALVLAYLGSYLLQPILLSQFGVVLQASLLTEAKIQTVAMVIVAGIIAGLIPAGLAYKKALSTSLKQ